MSDYSILLQREIYDILIGDTDLTVDVYSPASMPRYTAKELLTLCVRFGCQTDSQLSRWCHMENLLKHCIENDKATELLSYLFDFLRFRGTVSEMTTYEEKHNMYEYIVERALDEINEHLVFDRKKFVRLGNKFQVQSFNAPTIVQSEPLKSIDLNYIQLLTERIQHELNNDNFDTVLTKSRTLAEEVLIYILEENQEKNIPKGDFVELTKKVKSTLNMHQNKYFDKRINAMLSGLEKTIQAVIELRNV